jgi:hypothetical protein
MNNLHIKILSWLLHHANRLGKNVYFYQIKNKLLNKYGTFLCYDIQFIEGKKCHSCRGTGIHHYYDFDGEIYDTDLCWHCHNGWYKRPFWTILAKIKFGEYKFHQPFKKVYEKPDNTIELINGYIEHTPGKYSGFALFVLCLLYEKKYLRRWYKETGNGYRLKWYLPKNYIYNFIHLTKFRFKSFPVKLFIGRFKSKPSQIKYSAIEQTEDLPF